MKQDDEIDKLFRDNLENSSMPDIPQAYLDDLNRRLDTITPQKRFRNFQSLFSILSVVSVAGIISLIAYFAVFNSTSDKLKNDKKYNSINSNFGNDKSNSIEKNNSNNEANTLAELNSKESKNIDTTIGKTASTSVSLSVSELRSDNDHAQQQLEKGTEINSNTSSSKRNNKTNNLVLEQPPTKMDKNTVDAKSFSPSKKQQSGNVLQSDKAYPDNTGLDTDNLLTSAKVKKGKVHKKLIDKSSDPYHNVVANKSSVPSKIKVSRNIEPENKAETSLVDVTDEALVEKKNIIQSTAPAKANKYDTMKSTDKKDLSDVSATKTEENKLSEVYNNIDSVRSNANKGLIVTADKKDAANSTNKQSNVHNGNLDSLKKANADTVTLTTKDSVKQNIATALQPLTDSSSNVLKAVKSVQLLMGAANVNSFFTSKNSNYDAKRKYEESTIWAFDASVLINYSKNKFVYSLGINISQWGENVKYTATVDTVKYFKGVDTTYTTVQIDSSNFLVVPNVFSSVGYETSNNTSTIYNGKNRYAYLSIPFLFGYEFGNTSFSIIPKIGGMLGVPLYSKAYYVSPDLKKRIHEKAVSWLFNFQVSLDLQKKLGTYTNISVSPFYRYNINPLIHSENTTNSYYSMGFQVGVSYIIH